MRVVFGEATLDDLDDDPDLEAHKQLCKCGCDQAWLLSAVPEAWFLAFCLRRSFCAVRSLILGRCDVAAQAVVCYIRAHQRLLSTTFARWCYCGTSWALSR